MVFTTVNTVVVAPIPRASVNIAKKENAGALLRLRNAYFVLRKSPDAGFPGLASIRWWAEVVTMVRFQYGPHLCAIKICKLWLIFVKIQQLK